MAARHPHGLDAGTSDASGRGDMLRWGAWVGALMLVTAAVVAVRAFLGAAHVVLAYLVVVLGATT